MTDTNTKPNKHEAERCTGQVWALNTCSNQPHFIEVRRLSGHVCVLGVMYMCVRYKESDWSCICVLGVMYMCVRGHVCVLGVMYVCVRGHVYVY